MFKTQMPLWWIKLTRFEFWPYWLFYFPMFFYGLYLALRSGSFSYFTAANPDMLAGGLVGEGKINMLKKIHADFKPNTILINLNEREADLEKKLLEAKLTFPLIAKPNKSERGIGVEKINGLDELKAFLSIKSGEFLLQEYIDYPIELGILYHRFPNGKSGISSIVQKEFLKVTGNGISTLKELIQANTRARFRLAYLYKKFENRLNEVLALDEKLLLEPIGNHNRGTAFLNANHLISAELLLVFDKIASSMQGFNYGRFDLKVKSIDKLYKGEDIKIMEVNGVESEPAHIYDPSTNIFAAYKSVLFHMRLLYQISNACKKEGATYMPFYDLMGAIRLHFAQRKLIS